MAIDTQPVLRSLLFVPANNRKLLESAVRRNADAIQLDLEDAIALSEKDSARKGAVEAIQYLKDRCPYIVVRINGQIRLAVHDLEATVIQGLNAVTVPKCPNPSYLTILDEAITELESERSLPVGSVKLIAMIENAEGLANVNEIATATPRLIALTVGPEDLASSLGSSPSPDAMYVPNILALTAARRAGIIPLGFAGSITVYKDTDTYTEWIVRAAALGFEGAFCIHPNQVDICNQIFQPSPDEIEDARELIAAFESYSAQGVGVFTFNDNTVDAPVVARARSTLAKAKAIELRSQGKPAD